jgi:hypothetical protein
VWLIFIVELLIANPNSLKFTGSIKVLNFRIVVIGHNKYLGYIGRHSPCNCRLVIFDGLGGSAKGTRTEENTGLMLFSLAFELRRLSPRIIHAKPSVAYCNNCPQVLK